MQLQKIRIHRCMLESKQCSITTRAVSADRCLSEFGILLAACHCRSLLKPPHHHSPGSSWGTSPLSSPDVQLVMAPMFYAVVFSIASPVATATLMFHRISKNSRVCTPSQALVRWFGCAAGVKLVRTLPLDGNCCCSLHFWLPSLVIPRRFVSVLSFLLFRLVVKSLAPWPPNISFLPTTCSDLSSLSLPS